MENEGKKNLYELAFWLSPDLNDEQAKAYLETMKAFVKEFNGEMKKENPLEKKKLAYAINKKTFGYFGVLYFYLESDKMPIFEKKLKAESSILRFMSLKVSSAQLASMEEQKPQTARIQPRFRQQMPEKEALPIGDKEDKRIKLEELDKKLEEILGKEIQ